jgi:hypothetical protein
LFLLCCVCACSESPTAPPDTSHIVKTPIFDCAQHRVASIDSSNGRFSLTGACDIVFVNGSNNNVTIQSSKTVVVDGEKNAMDINASDKVTVNGRGNLIKAKKGLTGKTSAVAAIGDENIVVQEQ